MLCFSSMVSAFQNLCLWSTKIILSVSKMRLWDLMIIAVWVIWQKSSGMCFYFELKHYAGYKHIGTNLAATLTYNLQHNTASAYQCLWKIHVDGTRAAVLLSHAVKVWEVLRNWKMTVDQKQMRMRMTVDQKKIESLTTMWTNFFCWFVLYTHSSLQHLSRTGTQDAWSLDSGD